MTDGTAKATDSATSNATHDTTNMTDSTAKATDSATSNATHDTTNAMDGVAKVTGGRIKSATFDTTNAMDGVAKVTGGRTKSATFDTTNAMNIKDDTKGATNDPTNDAIKITPDASNATDGSDNATVGTKVSHDESSGMYVFHQHEPCTLKCPYLRLTSLCNFSPTKRVRRCRGKSITPAQVRFNTPINATVCAIEMGQVHEDIRLSVLHTPIDMLCRNSCVIS